MGGDEAVLNRSVRLNQIPTFRIGFPAAPDFRKPSKMRIILVLALISVLGLPFPASSNGLLWSRITGTKDIDEDGRIAVDSRKNIYLAFRSRIDEEDAGESDDSFPRMRLIKHDSTGKRMWIRTFESSSSTYPTDMAVDAEDNVYVLGRFMEHIEGNRTLGDYDAYLIKLDGNGKIQWSRTFGTKGVDFAETMAIGKGGSIYVTAYTNGVLEGQVKPGKDDILLAKFDSKGGRSWTRLFGSEAVDIPSGIALDARENIYLAQESSGFPGEGPKHDSTLISLVKFDSSGTKHWKSQFGSKGSIALKAIAVDGLDGIYLSGATKVSLDGKNAPSKGDFESSYFLTKYDSEGARLWMRQSGRSADPISMAADGSGNAYVFGNTSDSLDGQKASRFGGLFLLKYDKDGSRRWTRIWGTGATEAAQDMAVDKEGFLYLTGRADGASKGLDGLDLGIMKWTPEPPSFDCAKAATHQEKMICWDFQLSRLDDSIATLYSAARKSAPRLDEIKAEQTDWLKFKRNACKTPEDLRRTLRERVEVLKVRTGSR